MNLTKTLHENNTVKADYLSDQYAPVSTKIVLAPFFNNGWTVERSRKTLNKNGVGKEHITLSHPDFLYPSGDKLTVECLNSNDGSKALRLMGGYCRLVCENGLIIGDLEGGRFVHRGTAIYERIEETYDKIVAHLKTIAVEVETLKSVELSEEQVDKAIDLITSKVFEKDTKKYKVTADISPNSLRWLKRVRREADRGKDAFTLLNVIQENIVRKGHLWANVTTLNKETNEVTVDTKSKNRMESSMSSIEMNKIISKSFLEVVKEVA
jgi:hypothetical protein